MHAKFEKNSQCWQEFYLSGNEIWNFFRKIVIFRYHWQVKYLSAIQSVNHPLPISFYFDKCFSCQCMIFLYFLISLTSFFPSTYCWGSSQFPAVSVFRSSWLDSPFPEPPRATQGEIIIFFRYCSPAFLNYIGAFWARPDFRYTNFFLLAKECQGGYSQKSVKLFFVVSPL